MKETQVFLWKDLNLTKMTLKICNKNGIQKLPSALYVKLFKTDEGKMTLLLMDFNLTLMTIDLESDFPLIEIMKISDLIYED